MIGVRVPTGSQNSLFFRRLFLFYLYLCKKQNLMQRKVSKTTKLKVIGGYALLFLLTILSTILIYREITKLILSEGTASDANRKLFIVSNTITNLYEAETLSNAFIQTGANSYFHQYATILEETEVNIDSLRFLTTQLNQVLRLDTIAGLLRDKLKNLQDLVYVKNTFVPEDFYNQAIASIESGKDTLTEEVTIRSRYVTTLDTTYTVTERRRRRLFGKTELDTVQNVIPSYHVVYDTLTTNNNEALSNTDTVVNILRATWENVQKHNENINRQINRREYALIRQSTEISDQLKRILGEYEKEELHAATLKQENREQTVTTMIRIFAWIAVVAFILVVFFTFFILRDISRSQRYRRELETANQYADSLLKSREKMILTVTHDIKSPLSSILGYIELLTSTPISDRQRYFLKNMQGSSNHILQLVGNLLDLSKLENNKMQVEEVVFNPCHLFQEIADNFMPLAVAKSLKLEGQFSKDLDGDYKGDALRIRQIVTNILSNAVKYTAQGGIFFKANLSVDRSHLILKIEDTGSGMTPEEQKLIFEEFTRLKSHSAIEGTGLGLTITLKLIHLLRGEMKLQSQPGKGSCFTIILPLKKAAVSHAPVAVTPPAVPEESPECGGDVAVLVVDDDPLQLAMTANILANYGIQATTTEHPKEVPALLQERHFDMVFSDIQMPEMNGFELVAQIRALPGEGFDVLPVVALSADSDKAEEEYHRAGFTAYLPKPFQAADLIRLIGKLTGKVADRPLASQAEGQETEGYTLKNILQFTDNDPEALQKILQSFVTSTAEHLRLLEAARGRKDTQEVSRIAHKMLPLFRQLEAAEAVKCLQQLEHPEKENLSPQQIDDTATRLIHEAEELLARLKASFHLV